MANQKTYTITIEGLSESYEGVKSLVDVLNQLSDKNTKVVTTTEDVTNAEQKQSSAVSDSTKSVTDKKEKLDALGKAQKQLSEYDVEYQTELAKTKAEIAANNKEIKDLIKQQEAAAVVEAKQLDTYAEKQQYLSALNVLIRNHSQETEEDRAAIESMVQESAALQEELKEFDANMQQFTRNVGNYPEAANMVIESNRSMKQEIRELTAEMAEMLANGVSKTDEAYLALAERAGQLKDAMSDASADIAHFASDTSGLDNVVNLAQSGVAAFQLYQSTMTLFGDENEEASEAMKTLMATMSALQALQTVQNTLLSNGTATGKLYTAMVDGLKSMLGLKRTEVEANNVVDQESIAINDSKAASDQMLVSTEQELAMVEQEVASSKQINATASSEEAAATASNTSTTQTNTAAKQANASATTTMSGATRTADTTTKALSASTKTATTSTTGLSAAQKAGAVASRTLGAAMKAIPLMAIIGLVTTLITHWKEIWNWLKKTFPVLGQVEKGFKKMGGVMNALKAVCKGVFEAIKNWIINPFKTMADVIGKILKGDFSGAIEAAKQGLVNQFKGTGEAFSKAFNESLEGGIAENKAAEKMADTQRQIEDLEDKGMAKGKQYHNLKMQQLDQEAAAAQGNQEKLREIERKRNQENTRYREEQESGEKSSHSSAMQRSSERAAADKSNHNARMKQIDDEKKAQEDAAKEYAKLIEDINKKITQSFEKATKAENAVAKHEWDIQADYAKFRQEQLQKDAFQSLVKMDKDMADWQYHQAEVWFNMRKVMAVNSYGQELEAAKQTYKKELDFIAQTMRETNAAIDAAKKRGDTETVTSLEEKLDQLDKAYDRLQAALTKEFGRFWDRSIIIPVDFDLEATFKEYVKLVKYLQDNAPDIEPISFDTFVDTKIGGVYDLISQMNDEIRTTNKYYYDLWQVLKLSGVEAQQIKDILDVVTDPKKYDLEYARSAVLDAVREFDFFIDQTSNKGYDMMNKMVKMNEDFVKSVNDVGKKALDESTKYFTEQIKSYEDYVKKMQDAFKSIKQNPVRREDMFSGQFGGDVIDRGATKKRYEELLKAAEDYYNTVKSGSKERTALENEWQNKLNVTKMFYGEESKEYQKALADREKAFSTYAANEIAAEEQLQKAKQKVRDADNEYYDDLSKRMKKVFDIFSENVLDPIADTFSALFSYELDEMNEYLDRLSELLEDATNLREESANRIEEINSQLRDSDSQNLDALRQRLADEEVLLAERQAMERKLQLEKEDQEKRIQAKEKQQKKAELLQSFFESIANTAVGVTAALKYGPILGPIFAAIIGAMGAAQSTIIAAQINKLKDGGLLEGASHNQGGMRIQGTNIEVEGGEFVVNKKSTRKYLPLLEKINNEGRTNNRSFKPMGKFAQGGKLNVERASRAAEYGMSNAAFERAIGRINMKPQVSVVEINEVNDQLSKVEVLSGFKQYTE